MVLSIFFVVLSFSLKSFCQELTPPPPLLPCSKLLITLLCSSFLTLSLLPPQFILHVATRVIFFRWSKITSLLCWKPCHGSLTQRLTINRHEGVLRRGIDFSISYCDSAYTTVCICQNSLNCIPKRVRKFYLNKPNFKGKIRSSGVPTLPIN